MWECRALAKSQAGFPTGQAKCPFCPTTLASWSESAWSATGPRTVCWRWLGIPRDMRKEEQVVVSHATKIALSFRQGNTGTFTFPGPSLTITCVQNTVLEENTSPMVSDRGLPCTGRVTRAWQRKYPLYRAICRGDTTDCLGPGKSTDQTRPGQTRQNQNNNNKTEHLPNVQIKARECSFSFEALGTDSSS